MELTADESTTDQDRLLRSFSIELTRPIVLDAVGREFTETNLILPDIDPELALSIRDSQLVALADVLLLARWETISDVLFPVLPGSACDLDCELDVCWNPGNVPRTIPKTCGPEFLTTAEF